MKKDKIRKKLDAVHSEIRDINHKLNTLFFMEYGVREVAAELRLSRSTIYKIDPFKLPYRKRGKFRIYLKEDVIKYKSDL